MPRMFLAFFALSIMLVMPALSLDFQKGSTAAPIEDFATALRERKLLANQGDADFLAFGKAGTQLAQASKSKLDCDWIGKISVNDGGE